MQVIKNINNNVSLCLDSAGIEVVAFGKGIGFKRPPYEIDLEAVDKTFYGVNEAYVQMVQDVPVEVIEVSTDIVDYAKRRLPVSLSPNIVFTLADHINFAIQRVIKNMHFDLPITQDIRHLFKREVAVGTYALTLIRERLHITMPDEEALYIALHIINGEAIEAGVAGAGDERHIERISTLIEQGMGCAFDRDGFAYARFVSHMHYLLRRGSDGKLAASSSDEELHASLAGMYPEAAACADRAGSYIEAELGWQLTHNELVYLIMHIVRLRAEEAHDG